MSTSRGWRLGALAAALLFALPSVARAEDEPGGDLKAKIREQMERVRELMQKNEAALLELSTGKDASPRDVDIDVPPPDASSGGQSGSDASSGGTAGTSAAEETVRQIEELLGGGGSGSGSGDGMIPDELKRLVQMVPL